LASNIFSAKCQLSEVRAAAVIVSPEIASNMRKIAQLGDLQLRPGEWIVTLRKPGYNISFRKPGRAGHPLAGPHIAGRSTTVP
jgi:hypothetical protein